MKRVLCLALVMSAPFAFADEAATLTKAMQATMDQYCKAIVKKDFKTADKIILANFAPDCKFVSQGKTIDLKTWMSMNNQQIKAMKTITKLSMKLNKVKVTGKKATGVESFVMTAVLPPNGNSKKSSVLDVTASNMTSMEKRNGKWLCTKVVSTPGKIMLDGKPLDISGAPKK